MTGLSVRSRGMRPRRAGVVVALAAVVTALLVGSAPSASGDAISDKKAQAAQITARISQLNGVVEKFAEQANAAKIELDSLNGQVADSQVKVAAAQSQVDQHVVELRAYAVAAYVRGGDTNQAAAFTGATDIVTAGQRAGYLAAAAGNRQQLIDTLDATQQDLQVQIAKLNDQKAAAESKAQAMANARAQAQSAVSEQQALKNQTDAELNQLIAAEQARQEAARQAAAQERAAAAAAAAAAARRLAPVAAPSAPTGPGAPSPGPSGGGGAIANPGPSSGNASVAVNKALAQQGKPYVWGAAGPDSFDCSGLMQYAWRAAGVELPHNTNAQYASTRHVSVDALQPGDIVYYDGFGHNGMYIGNAQIVHAPHSGAYVEVVSLYWVGNPIAASRP